MAILIKNMLVKMYFQKNLEEKVGIARFFREKSYYVDFYIVTKEECQEQIETARTVIEEIEKYIDNNK